MDMSETKHSESESRADAISGLDPRHFSQVPPPPMQVVYKGWWNNHTTMRQAADLAREDREREDRR
jgi:hypothetical protein